MLKFWSVINCIFVHWTKKLTLVLNFDTWLYRTNIENGQDEEVDRTESDTLNDFPSMKMTLLPGGCGFYEIPIKPGQVYAYIQPAKKEGEIYWVSTHSENPIWKFYH